MNLSFDSIADLNEFLHWADKYRAVDLTANRTRDLIGPAVDDGPLPTIDASAGMPPPVTGDPSGAALSPADPGAADRMAPVLAAALSALQPTEPAKRKRRTKAEIEADEKAVADAAGADLKAATEQFAPAQVANAGPNPFEQAATAPAGEPAAGAEGGESDVVTPFQHLTRAREFIAKHGMPKYNESFAKAGLDANVMGYTAYQRGVHMAALDELEKV